MYSQLKQVKNASEVKYGHAHVKKCDFEI